MLQGSVQILKHISITIAFMLTIPVHAENHHPQEFLKKIAGDKHEGQLIYEHFCINCHAQKPLIALGAPKIGNEEDWNGRVKKGLNALYENTNEGFNAMPPRGGCFECSDEQLVLAIITMLPKKAQKSLIRELLDHK